MALPKLYILIIFNVGIMDAIVFDRKNGENLEGCINRVEKVLGKYSLSKSEDLSEEGYIKRIYNGLSFGCVGGVYRPDNADKLSLRLENVNKANARLNEDIQTDNVLLLENIEEDLYEEIKKEII